MEEHRLALPAGYRIENYEIQAVLGKGGFGITYVAYDWTLGRHMAIKELLPDTIATRIDGSTVVAMGPSHEESWQWARERFVEEARILAGFRHPNIIAVHRLIEANGTVYLVMDHLEGESYETRLRRIGREPDQASLMAVIGPLLDGLQEVHAAGLLHRDIKPENILFDKRGNPILIDFGAARATVGATMTMTSIVTHGYSPIEQYQTKGKMGPWTDIYAIGAVMCRAITGEKPPVASDRITEDEFSWLSYRVISGFSESFLLATDWGLKVQTRDRPQTISEWRTYIQPDRNKSNPAQAMFPDQMEVVALVTKQNVGNSSSLPQDPLEEKKPTVIKPGKKKYTKDPRFVLAAVASAIVVLVLILLLFIQPSPTDNFWKGIACFEGKGVPKNDELGLKLILKAAKGGSSQAQTLLGDLYSAGVLLPKDQAKGIEYYQKAANAGNPQARYLLGRAYLTPFGYYAGVDRDLKEAARLFKEAAKQGYPDAQVALGELYDKGEGVAKDEAVALMWFKEAAKNGSSEGLLCEGMLLTAQAREMLFKELEKKLPNLTIAKLTIAKHEYQKGINCYTNAAEMGETTAMNFLCGEYESFVNYFEENPNGVTNIEDEIKKWKLLEEETKKKRDETMNKMARINQILYGRNYYQLTAANPK